MQYYLLIKKKFNGSEISGQELVSDSKQLLRDLLMETLERYPDYHSQLTPEEFKLKCEQEKNDFIEKLFKDVEVSGEISSRFYKQPPIKQSGFFLVELYDLEKYISDRKKVLEQQIRDLESMRDQCASLD